MLPLIYFMIIMIWLSCHKTDDAWKKITHMLFADWEVRIVKNCDRGLMLHFHGRGHRLTD